MRTGHDHPIDLLGAQLGGLQRRVPRLLAERHVLRLAEALLPDLRAALARLTPPVDELLGGVTLPEHGGQQRPVGVRTDQERGGAVAAGGLVGAGRQAIASVGGDHEHRVAPVERREQRRHPGPDRAHEVGGDHVGVEPQGGVDGGGVRLVQVGGIGGREPQGPRLAVGGAAEREAGRLDAHRGRVLVVAGDRPAAPSTSRPEGLGDRGPVEAAVRNVAGSAQNPLHPNLFVARPPARCQSELDAERTRRARGPVTPTMRACTMTSRGASAEDGEGEARGGRQRRRRAVRQAARRGAGARRRADAGVALRHPAAGTPGRRRREGRASGRRGVGPGGAAGHDRPHGAAGRGDVPAQQPEQAQRRHRPQGPRGAGPVPRPRRALRRGGRELQARDDVPDGSGL